MRHARRSQNERIAMIAMALVIIVLLLLVWGMTSCSSASAHIISLQILSTKPSVAVGDPWANSYASRMRIIISPRLSDSTCNASTDSAGRLTFPRPATAVTPSPSSARPSSQRRRVCAHLCGKSFCCRISRCGLWQANIAPGKFRW